MLTFRPNGAAFFSTALFLWFVLDQIASSAEALVSVANALPCLQLLGDPFGLVRKASRDVEIARLQRIFGLRDRSASRRRTASLAVVKHAVVDRLERLARAVDARRAPDARPPPVRRAGRAQLRRAASGAAGRRPVQPAGVSGFGSGFGGLARGRRSRLRAAGRRRRAAGSSPTGSGGAGSGAARLDHPRRRRRHLERRPIRRPTSPARTHRRSRGTSTTNGSILFMCNTSQQERSSARRAATIARRTPLLSRVRCSRLREDQPEPRAAAGRRLHFDFAVVQLDDAVDHRQADAAAFFLGREIQIENPAEVLGRNPDAGVLDVDLDPAAARSRGSRCFSVPPSGIAWHALSARFSSACASMPGSALISGRLSGTLDLHRHAAAAPLPAPPSSPRRR